MSPEAAGLLAILDDFERKELAGLNREQCAALRDQAEKVFLGRGLNTAERDRVQLFLIKVNRILAERECAEGVSRVRSTPVSVNIGGDLACNARCVFCMGRTPSEDFSLRQFRELFEKNAGDCLRAAENISFCGFGEMLAMPDAERFLAYLDSRFPQNRKMFTTNGIALREELDRHFLNGRYMLKVSLHAVTADTHRKITGTRAFDLVRGNLRRLCAAKKRLKSRLDLGISFVINTLNINEIPDFVSLGRELDVDEVRFDYMVIYTKEQVPLSVFFRQEESDRMLTEARARAAGAPFRFVMPPLFSEERLAPAPKKRCEFPWNWVHLMPTGVTHCCYAGEVIGCLKKNTLSEIWNGIEHARMRGDLANGRPNKWCRHCLKSCATSINNFSSHVSQRAGSQVLIEEYRRLKTNAEEVKV